MALSVVNRFSPKLSHTNMLIRLVVQEVDSKSQNNLLVYIFFDTIYSFWEYN